jgi:hypothetical protein
MKYDTASKEVFTKEFEMKKIISTAWEEADKEASKDLDKHGDVTPRELRLLGFSLICTAWFIALYDLGPIGFAGSIFAAALGLVSIFLSVSVEKTAS